MFASQMPRGVLFDPNALTAEDPTAGGEERFVTIGMDPLGQVLVVVYTYRGDDLRLISVRRATRKERSMKREYNFRRGRRGAVIPQKGKTRITIYIDDDVLEEFRDRADAVGRGYHTMINEALREYLNKSRQPIDEATLRRVIREEMRGAG